MSRIGTRIWCGSECVIVRLCEDVSALTPTPRAAGWPFPVRHPSAGVMVLPDSSYVQIAGVSFDILPSYRRESGGDVRRPSSQAPGLGRSDPVADRGPRLTLRWIRRDFGVEHVGYRMPGLLIPGRRSL
jgi:hypothetical protein